MPSFRNKNKMAAPRALRMHVEAAACNGFGLEADSLLEEDDDFMFDGESEPSVPSMEHATAEVK